MITLPAVHCSSTELHPWRQQQRCSSTGQITDYTLFVGPSGKRVSPYCDNWKRLGGTDPSFGTSWLGWNKTKQPPLAYPHIKGPTSYIGASALDGHTKLSNINIIPVGTERLNGLTIYLWQVLFYISREIQNCCSWYTFFCFCFALQQTLQRPPLCIIKKHFGKVIQSDTISLDNALIIFIISFDYEQVLWDFSLCRINCSRGGGGCQWTPAAVCLGKWSSS